MNHKECVARGCALTAAMRTGALRGNVLDIQDVYPFRTTCQFRQTPRAASQYIEILATPSPQLLHSDCPIDIFGFRAGESTLEIFSDSPQQNQVTHRAPDKIEYI